MIRRSLGGLAAGIAMIPALTATAVAQRQGRGPHIQPEARVDAFLARRDAVHGGIGLSVPLGGYVRVQAVAAAGVTEGPSPASGRVDLIARFVLDPYREYRWGLYGFGGLSAWVQPANREFIVVGLGLEMPEVAGILPTVEVGLGGGTRIGLIARRAIAGAR